MATRFFGVEYASEKDFLRARGVLEHSCSKGFRLTPTPTQEERKAFYSLFSADWYGPKNLYTSSKSRKS